jgi:diguanylate cyclase (GGDEF)-like protein
MLTKQVIEALTAAASAATRRDSDRALACARDLLGAQAAACEPLLSELARRSEELHQLRDLAGRDPLTGAANRRTFEEELTREVARHRRTREAFAVILIDVDDLKQRNDRHGHQAGDSALTALVQAAMRTVRETDVVARIGGDEFAVLLPGSNHAGASILAARLREAVEQCEVDGGALRVSVGIAAAEHGRSAADVIVKSADLDLYKDKEHRKREQRDARAA